MDIPYTKLIPFIFLFVSGFAAVFSSLQESEWSNQLNKNPDLDKAKVKRSVEANELKDYFEGVGVEFYELSKQLITLTQMMSQLKNETSHIFNDVLSELSKTNGEIANIKITQNQVRDTLMEKLMNLDLKVEAGFENSLKTHLQQDRRIDAVLQELLKKEGSFEDFFESAVDSVKTCKSLNAQISGAQNGIYRIGEKFNEIQAFCDMESDGGGWTVIQRRGVRSMSKPLRQSFNQTWTQYENGFGSYSDDHWIGLRQMHILTRDCENELKVILTAWNGTQFYAKYSNFQVSGRRDNYRLNLGQFTAGTLRDEMHHNNGMKFSTYDNNDDTKKSTDCNGGSHTGAWWNKICTWVSLNGEYADDGNNGRIEQPLAGIYWDPATTYSYKKSEMKIRSKC